VVQVDVTSDCPDRLSWRVLTTAYRVVARGEQDIMGKNAIVWDGRDLKGRRVSNGLYYFEVFGMNQVTPRIPVILLR
jgi:flagellar hook assembly protein FlgD